MFSGIVEGIGRVASLQRKTDGWELAVDAADLMEGAREGDSIAVNGTCLTARSLRGRLFYADISPETGRTTTLAGLAPGQQVNLERALRLGDRLGGHLVTGHVDGVGTIGARRDMADAFEMEVAAPPEVARFLVSRGSVAVDGVSLTVVRCDETTFAVSIIPHTAASTTLGLRHPGDAVNLEADLLGKYVARFWDAAYGPGTHPDDHPGRPIGGLTRQLLADHGF